MLLFWMLLCFLSYGGSKSLFRTENGDTRYPFRVQLQNHLDYAMYVMEVQIGSPTQTLRVHFVNEVGTLDSRTLAPIYASSLHQIALNAWK